MPTSYQTSDARWPIVDFVYNGPLIDAEIPALLAEYARPFERRAAYVIVHDARQAGAPTRRQRYLVSDWIRSQDQSLREYNIGSVFILESLAVRLAVQFILMLSPLPNETHVCRTMADAERWIADCFRRWGLDANGNQRQRA